MRTRWTRWTSLHIFLSHSPSTRSPSDARPGSWRIRFHSCCVLGRGRLGRSRHERGGDHSCDRPRTSGVRDSHEAVSRFSRSRSSERCSRSASACGSACLAGIHSRSKRSRKRWSGAVAAGRGGSSGTSRRLRGCTVSPKSAPRVGLVASTWRHRIRLLGARGRSTAGYGRNGSSRKSTTPITAPST